MLAGRRPDRGADVARGIAAAGGAASFVETDVADGAAIDRLVAEAVDLGGVDIAVNNAGVFDRAQAFHSYGDESWDEVIGINLTAVFRCMRAELAAMVERGADGVIVNTTSTVSHRGSLRAGPAYVAAKHAVLGLTRQAALEYAAHGIRVNAVSPGPTATEIAEPLIAEGEEAVAAALGGLNPTARFVQPDEVAAAVLYLCTDAAASVNGHDIVIDGGQLAQL